MLKHKLLPQRWPLGAPDVAQAGPKGRMLSTPGTLAGTGQAGTHYCTVRVIRSGCLTEDS